jgi:methionyl-tRNA formyltransferase
MERDLKIVFMGTPEFAVESLQALVRNKYSIAAVITAPDTLSGRGMRLIPSPVKQYALEQSLKILQPPNLKDPVFVEELRKLEANLFIVVAFRMLPEIVWQIPELGTFNLHASLLPQYRGAAPINRAIMNGETETGVTTFFLKQEIDTGQIIFTEKVAIGQDETAGEVHDRLKIVGAGVLLNTVRAIAEGQVKTIDQALLAHDPGSLKKAPKIFKEDCKIDWLQNIHAIHNFVRGLSPYPGAFTNLVSPSGEQHYLKIYRTSMLLSPAGGIPGRIITDGRSFLRVSVDGGLIQILELQQSGKRRMAINEFLMGFPVDDKWNLL